MPTFCINSGMSSFSRSARSLSLATSSLVRTYAGLNSLSSSSTAAHVKPLRVLSFGVPVRNPRTPCAVSMLFFLEKSSSRFSVANVCITSRASSFCCWNLAISSALRSLILVISASIAALIPCNLASAKANAPKASSIWSRVTPETTTFLTLVFAIVIKMKVGYFFLLAPSNIR